MTVLAFTLAATVLLTAAVAAMLRVDQSFTRQVRQCCRCLHVYGPGIDRLCPRCVTARGRLARHGLIEPRPENGFDWQGHMETGPIPVVAK